MFDIGWGKIIIIAVIALIVIGPKELPAVLRTAGQWMGKIRRMAAEFQNQFQEAMREAEMADLKKSVDAITEATRDIGGGFDPVGTVRKHIEGAFDEKPAGTDSGTTTPSTAMPPVGETAGAVTSAEAAAAPLPNPVEPELPFPEPAPPVTSRDIVPEPAPEPATPVAPAAAAIPDAGGRPA